MSDQSSAELEREAEAARAKVAGTAQSIRNKLTAGQMIDEFSEMLTGGDLSGMAHNLKAQVRDNPLPIALVGAGIAWLAFGRGVTGQPSNGAPGHHVSVAQWPKAGPSSDQHGSLVSTVTEGAKSIAEGAKSAIGAVGETVGEMASGAASKADNLRHGVASGGGQLPRAASNLADQEPLLIAALGLTFGAVIGALLPATEFEKEQIGPQADRLRETAKELLEKGRDSAERVASTAFDALKHEADRQGLSSEGPSVGERLGKVVTSAADAAGDAVRDELGASGDDTPKDAPTI
ncbi:hypothetical protein [Kaistia defluvii]|uniref:DUF3618 domain-containing protein n=1 Tax=Kaistia defluvii TaxID=410841 RepID=A0ABV2R0Y8_9HYPH